MTRTRPTRRSQRWQVEYRQVDSRGRLSRPRIVCDGKPVRLSQRSNAELAAAAPELLDTLEELVSSAELWSRMIRSEHPRLDVSALTKAQALLSRVRVRRLS
jgi:hypothetical protein